MPRDADGGADSIGDVSTVAGPTMVRELSAPHHVRVTNAPLAPLDFSERYVPREVLGEGGMGVVQSFDDRQIGRAIAMKLMRREHRAVAESETRFLREARVQGQLEHPAVVPVYDIGIDPEGSVYFTMKRVRGTTLHDVLGRLRSPTETYEARYSRRRLLTAFASVCLAVDFAHRRGVLHRDLKPGNVMLGDFGEVYVLDWGLARLSEGEREPEVEPLRMLSSAHETQFGAVLGTPGYMAPEQIKGELDRLGPVSDIYSLGAILFEILTQLPLHQGANIEQLLESTLAGAEARPSVRAPTLNVAPELEAIVVKATALDPKERYASAGDLNEAIERYLDGERNLEQRQQMAAAHVKAAAQAARNARHATDAGLHLERREALRSVGRALALDPDNPRALEMLMRLLREPPMVLPPEVRAEIDRSERDKLRWVGKLGGYAYLHLLLYIPVFLWVGVRDWTWILVLLASGMAASGVSFYVSRQKKPSTKLALVVMALSNVALASTAAMFGPLFFMPTFIAVNASGFALYFEPRARVITMVTSVVALLVPMLLLAVDLMPGGYRFTASGISILRGALEFPPAATIVLLTMANVLAVVIGQLMVTRVRDALNRIEQQLFLYTWQLREFVPVAARAASDPVLSRSRLR